MNPFIATTLYNISVTFAYKPFRLSFDRPIAKN